MNAADKVSLQPTVATLGLAKVSVNTAGALGARPAPYSTVNAVSTLVISAGVSTWSKISISQTDPLKFSPPPAALAPIALMAAVNVVAALAPSAAPLRR